MKFILTDEIRKKLEVANMVAKRKNKERKKVFKGRMPIGGNQNGGKKH